MHEMQTIVTDDRSVCLSVCHVAQLGSMCSVSCGTSLCGGHLVQPLPNHFGFLFVFLHCCCAVISFLVQL